MKVFISWSGTTSRSCALALAEWLPSVLQVVTPFVSSKIEKGEDWAKKIHDELAGNHFGIACVTNDNLASPWLHYEVGAMRNRYDGRVSPLLFGLQPADLSTPLSQLQATTATKEDMRQLILDLNSTCDRPVDEKHIQFDKLWDEFDNKVSQINLDGAANPPAPSEPPSPTISTEDYLKELAHGQERIERRIHTLFDHLGSADREALTRNRAMRGRANIAARRLSGAIDIGDFLVTNSAEQMVQWRVPGRLIGTAQLTKAIETAVDLLASMESPVTLVSLGVVVYSPHKMRLGSASIIAEMVAGELIERREELHEARRLRETRRTEASMRLSEGQSDTPEAPNPRLM